MSNREVPITAKSVLIGSHRSTFDYSNVLPFRAAATINSATSRSLRWLQMRPTLLFTFGLRFTLLAVALLAAGTGCASRRTIVITATPRDATLSLDGLPRGHGTLREKLSFSGGQTYTLKVSRFGFTDQIIVLDGELERDDVHIDLKPRSRRLRFAITPLPAIVKVDGNPIDPNPVAQGSIELPFAIDAKNNWVPHVASAERPGYRRAERLLRFTDPEAIYNIVLEPERKDVVIVTEPAGAEVFVDGALVGPSPARLDNLTIATNPQTNEWIGRKVRATKSGYEPAEAIVSWDNGKTEYVLKLGVRSKTVRIRTEPVDAVVKIGNLALPRDAAGLVQLPLDFVPHGDKQELPEFEIFITPANDTAKLAPAKLTIGWEDGKLDYAVKLAAPSAVGVASVRPKWVRGANGWSAEADLRTLTVGPSTDEPAGVRVTRFAAAPPSATIGSIATSADGSLLTYTNITATAEGLRSQVWIRNTEADRLAVSLTDGMALDLQPSFAPDSSRVIFISDRGENHKMGLYEASTTPGGPAKKLFDSEGLDLWPTLDSSPQPRLYVEARPVVGQAFRLISLDVATGKRIDLKQDGAQPRVSPRADAVVFVRADPRTGKRDLYLLKEGEEKAINLTNSPDEDDFDPAWSKDGSRIAYASNRPVSGSKPASTDSNIWVLDVAAPGKSILITQNTADDDCPAWSGDDVSLFFRSARGGDWGVWKVDLPTKGK